MADSPSLELTPFPSNGPLHQHSVHSGGSVRRTDGPSPQDWVQYRPKIEDLRRQDKTVKEIVSIMMESHGFKASERMYKQRLRHWGMEPKYLKADEMFAAAEIMERRRRECKATVLWIRGVLVDEVRIQKFTKRNGRRPASAIDGPIPPTIRVVTPEPAPSGRLRMSLPRAPSLVFDEAKPNTETTVCRRPVATRRFPDRALPARVCAVRRTRPTRRKQVPSNNETPTESGSSAGYTNLLSLTSPSIQARDQVMRPLSLGLGEDLLVNIQGYYRNTYFLSDSWSPWTSERFRKEPSPYPTTMGPDVAVDGTVARPTTDDPSQIVGSIEIAVRLFAIGKAKEAGFLLHQACDKFHKLLSQQHPQFITTVLLLTTMLRQNSPPRLFEVLMLQLYNMAVQVLKPGHPITAVISALARLATSSEEVLDRAFNLIADEYCTSAGAFHPQYLEARNIYAWSLLRRNKLADADYQFSQLRDKYERLAGSLNLCTRKTLYGLAQVHLAQQDLTATESLLLDIQRRIETAFGEDAIVELKIECLRLRASLYKRMAMQQETRSLTLRAFGLGKQLLSPYHPTMLLLEQEMLGCLAREKDVDETEVNLVHRPAN